MKTYYVIRDLKVPVYFGIYDGGQETLVYVPVTIELAMNYAPKGQLSDELEHTPDYNGICEKVMEVSSGKVFNLIERMVGVIYDNVRDVLPTGVFLRVSAIKEISINGHHSTGVRYSFTDDPEKFRQVL